MDEIEEKLISLSEDEKIGRLKFEKNYYYKKLLIMSLKSDELKLLVIDELHDNDKAYLLKSIQSDKLKLNFIKDARIDNYQKADIAKSINSDELKIQALSVFKNSDDYNKKAIIITLHSDENKIKAMKQHIKNNYNYVEIIKSLSSSENKIANLELLEYSHQKREILRGIEFKDDEERLKAVESLDESLAISIIREMKDEEKIVQAIDLLTFQDYKLKAIMTLGEERRITFLGQLNRRWAQDEIIDSITDENIKIECLPRINDENLKCRVLASLQSDEQKLTQLQQLKLGNENNFAIVIASLQSDEIKLEKLREIKDSKNINLVKMSLNDREKLKETFLEENRKYSKIGLDAKITIGMEIECEGLLSSNIERLKKIAKKPINGELRGWETKGDASLDEGVELVSPILTDNKEDIEDIYMVCSMLQKCEQTVSERCGGHIHIGADYLKSKEAYVNLFEIWGNTEKIICKISNEAGTIPRIGVAETASPISPKLDKAIENETVNLESEEDLNQFISEIQKVQEERYSGLNLLNINNGKDTIEFRVSNGTINPDTWIENAKLYGRIVQISERLAEIEKRPEQSDEEKRLLELKDTLKDEIPEQEKMETLLELLFTEEERSVYRERYISNSELLKETPNEKNPFLRTDFMPVDFKKKKHSLDEFFSVAVNERTETVNEVTRETEQVVQRENGLDYNNNPDREEE